MHPLLELLLPLRQRWRHVAPVALALWCTYAYFVPGPGWNQNSRLALTRAMAEHGTVRIDALHETTGDKSRRAGHFYSDKAPGASLLALPAYEALYLSRRLLGGELPEVTVRPLDVAQDLAGLDPSIADRKPGDRISYNLAHRLALWVCGVFTGGVLTVVAVGMLYLLALKQLPRERDAAAVALTYGLGTLALPYASAFYGHQLCADFLLLGFGLAMLLPTDRSTRAGPAVIGLCLGLAVLCEYPAVVPAAVLAGLAAWRLGPRALGWLAAGGLPAAATLLGYHAVAFGGPFKTGYDFVYLAEFAEGMRVNYGIGRPSPAVLMQIMFGSYRGLFYVSPVLLLAAWGLAYQVRVAKFSALGRAGPQVAAAIVVFYLLLNAGYYMWDGGAAVGPRHLIPALPFLCIGLAPAVVAVPQAFRWLAGLSVVQAVLLAAASPEAPSHGNPLLDFAVPRLLAADSAADLTSGNLGLLLGLSGVLSLAPLAAIWILAVRGRTRAGRNPNLT